jgi:hypothetical protein
LPNIFQKRVLKMALTELDTFVQKFKQLWKSDQDAHLNLESHAGKAWVGLRLRLGEEPGPSQKTYKLPKTTNSPSKMLKKYLSLK